VPPSLPTIISDFAAGMKAADAKCPVAQSARSERTYLPGLGPFNEAMTVKLVMAELQQLHPERYGKHALEVSYPESARSKCDLCIGSAPHWDWAIEIKMLRLLGDNGLPNDNMLMHILSPYPEHHSALTDCEKLMASGLDGMKAILIYGYECKQRPIERAIDAFERLAGLRPADRITADAEELIHPVHQHARVFGWALNNRKGDQRN
jgi:hypothetical protein